MFGTERPAASTAGICWVAVPLAAGLAAAAAASSGPGLREVRNQADSSSRKIGSSIVSSAYRCRFAVSCGVGGRFTGAGCPARTCGAAGCAVGCRTAGGVAGADGWAVCWVGSGRATRGSSVVMSSAAASRSGTGGAACSWFGTGGQAGGAAGLGGLCRGGADAGWAETGAADTG